MKIIVTKNLNVRVGKPSVNAPCYNYLVPGSTIEVEPDTVKGDMIGQNDVWYKGLDGAFYWSGGVNSVNNNNQPQNNQPNTVDYNELLSFIPQNIRSTKGSGVTIAIIDSGCAKTYDDLTKQIIGRFDAYHSGADANDIAYNSHGTFISGILCASDQIEGIAPKANLIIIKVLDSLTVDSSAAVLDGLTWLLKNHKDDIDVINMSMRFNPAGYVDDFNTVFSGFRDETVLIASAGDDTDLYKTAVFFPASHDRVISVGAISLQTLNASGTTGINSKIEYIFPNVDYQSYSKEKIIIHAKGSSFATATTSGIMALLISNYKNTGVPYSSSILKSEYNKLTTKLVTQNFNETILKPYVV